MDNFQTNILVDDYKFKNVEYDMSPILWIFQYAFTYQKAIDHGHPTPTDWPWFRKELHGNVIYKVWVEFTQIWRSMVYTTGLKFKPIFWSVHKIKGNIRIYLFQSKEKKPHSLAKIKFF